MRYKILYKKGANGAPEKVFYDGKDKGKALAAFRRDFSRKYRVLAIYS